MEGAIRQELTVPLATLRERVLAFASLRDREHAAKKALAEAEAKFREENVHLITAARVAAEERTAWEQAIRDEARMEFLRYGDKTPAPGVTIRLNKRLDYDPDRALVWAKESGQCLALDWKAFEKQGNVQGLDFVEEVTDPTVCIATDLFSAFLDERKAKERAERDAQTF